MRDRAREGSVPFSFCAAFQSGACVWRIADFWGGITNSPQTGSAALYSPGQVARCNLWGVGQRIFFLHDGRTSDLLQAILAHDSSVGEPGTGAFPPSEAKGVIAAFRGLSPAEEQSTGLLARIVNPERAAKDGRTRRGAVRFHALPGCYKT